MLKVTFWVLFYFSSKILLLMSQVFATIFSEADGKQVINLRLHFNCNNAPNESKWELGAAFEVIFYFFE